MAVETLSEWLAAEGIVPVDGPGAIANPERVRALLIAAAQRQEALSYSELLGALDHRFTRPKMRALCKTLDAIDHAHPDEPSLAVLVVRESDRLPGQGWWIAARACGHGGAWTGPEAVSHVAALQQAIFRYWRAR